MASSIGLGPVSGFPRADEPGFDCADQVEQPWVKGGTSAKSEPSGGRFTRGLMPGFHRPHFTRGKSFREIRFEDSEACQESWDDMTFCQDLHTDSISLFPSSNPSSDPLP